MIEDQTLDTAVKLCKSERDRIRNAAWRAKNPGYAAAKSKARREKDIEATRAAYKADYAANREKRLASAKAYREKYPDRAKAADLKWKKENPEKYAAIRKASYEKNRESSLARGKAYKKARLATDPMYKLAHSIAGRLRASMKVRGYTKTSRTHKVLGCDWDFFKDHIERQFTKGMKWEGLGSEIHIDHIVPLATAKTEAEVIAPNHFTNLRPMWAEQNYTKRANITHLI